MSAVEVFSGLGAALNIALFLSQFPLVLQFIREGSSDRYPWLPSFALMSAMALWSGYVTFVIPTPQLYAGNFPGMIISFLNLVAFIVFASTWRRRATIALATVLALGAAWGFSAGVFLGGGGGGGDVQGGVVVLLSLFFWISPLPALRCALLDADASRVPVLLSCVQVVQSSIWITAGVLLNDKFIWGCNVGGLLAAILQLAVYALIRLRLHALAAAATAKPLEAVAAVDGAAAAAATEPHEAVDVGR